MSAVPPVKIRSTAGIVHFTLLALVQLILLLPALLAASLAVVVIFTGFKEERRLNDAGALMLCLIPIALWVLGIRLLIRLRSGYNRTNRRDLTVLYTVMAVFYGIGLCGEWQHNDDAFHLFEPSERAWIVAGVAVPALAAAFTPSDPRPASSGQ